MPASSPHEKKELIRCRIEQMDKALVIKAALLKGYNDVSSYMRDILLNDAKNTVKNYKFKKES